jgi:hypothetical protein
MAQRPWVLRGAKEHSMRLIAALLIALVPTIGFAEENCRVLVRKVTRINGDVRGVAQDAVTVDVLSAPADDSTLRAGQSHVFGIDHPSQKLEVGKARDLEVRWIACDGAFRRWETIREIGPERVVEDYGRGIIVGHRYRAGVAWEDEDLELVPPPLPPAHHGVGVHFENIDAFPELQKRDVAHTVVLEVLSQEIIHRGNMQWTTRYTVQILGIHHRDTEATEGDGDFF